MSVNRLNQVLIFLAFAFVGWALCGSVMMIGMQVTTLQITLIVHAIAAPIFFGVLTWIYFKRFAFTTPLMTASLFTLFVISMDVFVVAMLVEKSFAMFTNILGTWIPFALIFLSTYLVGTSIVKKNPRQVAR